MTISDRMLERSGLTMEFIQTGLDDSNFRSILEGMQLIYKGKSVLYGNYIETHGSNPTPFALMEHFADLKRKYIRAEHFMKRTLSGEKIDILELLDTYSDMAVYAAIGVQLIFHLEEKDGHALATDGALGGKSPSEGGSNICDPK